MPLSTSEWMPSDIMAALPVKKAATNLETAMARLAPMAPYTTIFEELPAIEKSEGT